ncbi:hypothetical protein EV702DRAFT_1053130 [Suillus placidus]|uniref:Uncharacterized protein n=1 Tax=Suillus placidus TaxID=48579 RepID=A0A9P7CV58_9AGAM|nr:hypothetical protein EV702DRAFT_1053130 [Suillus placidus]
MSANLQYILDERHFKPKGFDSHRRACEQHARDSEEDAEQWASIPAMQAVVPALTVQAAHDDGKSLHQPVIIQTEDFTLTNYVDVRNTWEAASHRLMLKFDGDSFIQFIDEPWTADAFWECQSQIPPDTKPLAFILYADKAKLLSFGREKGYPVIACLANLPVAIRNGNGVGGGQVVGWLPLIKDDPKYRDKDSEDCTAFDKWLMGELLGQYCEDKLSSIMPHNYPLCTSQATSTLLIEARAEHRKGRREVILESWAIRDVDNAFHDMNHKTTDVHHTLSNDRLHVDILSFFGDHMWSKLQLLIGLLGCDKVAQVDENKYEVIFKSYMPLNQLLTFAAHAVLLNAGESKLAYLLLQCICAYLEVDWCTALKVHTTKTIAAGQEALQEFSELMDILCADHWSLVSEFICGRVEELDAYNTQMAEHETDPDNNIWIEATEKSLEIIEEQHDNNPSFRHFRTKLNRFLNALPAVTQHMNMLPFDKHSHMTHPKKITEFQFLKVNYKSLVDFCQTMDYLCCSLSFHNLPRYDCVIVNTTTVRRRLQKDKHLKFWHVRQQPREMANGDIFLRMKQIYKSYLTISSNPEWHSLDVCSLALPLSFCTLTTIILSNKPLKFGGPILVGHYNGLDQTNEIDVKSSHRRIKVFEHLQNHTDEPQTFTPLVHLQWGHNIPDTQFTLGRGLELWHGYFKVPAILTIKLIHRLGLKKIRGSIANASNFQLENTTVSKRVQECLKKAWRHQLISYPDIISIQVGSKDRDEVIPAEMCIIALDQCDLPPEFLLSMVEFSSRIAWHSSALESTTQSQLTNALLLKFTVLARHWDHCNSKPNLSHQAQPTTATKWFMEYHQPDLPSANKFIVLGDS